MKFTKKSAITFLIIILFISSTLVTLGSIFLGRNKANTIVVMETTKGTIEIQLYNNNAPVTVQNFIGYVEDGFYDGTVFHRVIPSIMIQGGGYLPDGTEKPTKEPIILESDNGLKNIRGTIAMARTSIPNSATSQFFINLVDNDLLNYRPGYDGYAVFGSILKGMDVVDAIAGVRTGIRGYFEDWPLEDIIITKAYLKK